MSPIASQTAPIPLVDLKSQYRAIKPEIDAALSGILKQTAFVGGPIVADFEAAFANFCGTKHCAGTANGTVAISLALRGLGVGPGDEVITVSHTFIATVEAIISVGAKPVLVDIDPATMLMDVAQVEPAITSRTKVIVPVHLYGQMVDMDPIMSIAKAHGLKVVEDAAQAHGATYNNRRAGSLGDAGTFSFYPGKNLGAYGDGGAVVTNDDRLAAWLHKASDHGRSSKYEHDFFSMNDRLDTLHAAVLGIKLPHLDDWNQARRNAAGLYDQLLEDSPVTLTRVESGRESVYHLYTIRVPNRDAVLKTLHDDQIGAGVHYPIPVHKQPAWLNAELPSMALPNSERAADTLISLPLFPELTEEAIARVVRVLRASL